MGNVFKMGGKVFFNNVLFSQKNDSLPICDTLNTNSSFIAFDKVGNRIFITGLVNIIVLDATTFTLLSTISGFNRPNGIALDLDNNRFFVSNFTSGVVSVVNATTYSIINTISVGVGNGGQGLFYDADNNRLLVALYYSACRVIDLNTNTIVGSFGGGSSLGITLDKTGNKIVMGTEFSVSTYDATTYAYIATYPLGEGVDIAIDAEHDRIFVSDYSGKISIVKLSTMSLTRTIVTAPNLTGLWWDGVKLFYVTYLGNKLYMLK